MADNEKILQTCVHDYLLQNGMPELAQKFQLQADLRIDDLVNLPGPNFLSDFWHTFYDPFVAQHFTAPSPLQSSFPGFEQQVALTKNMDMLNQRLPISGSSGSIPSCSSQKISPFPRQDLEIDQNITLDFGGTNLLNFDTFSSYGGKKTTSSVPASGMPLLGQSISDFLGNPLNFDTYEMLNPIQQKSGLSISGDGLWSSSTSMNKSPSTGKRKFDNNARILNAVSKRPNIVKKVVARNQIDNNLRNVTLTMGGTGETNADFYNTVTNDLGSSLVAISSMETPNSQLICRDFSSEGEILACISKKKMVHLWNAVDNGFMSSPKNLRRFFTDVRFAPNSSYLAACSSENTVQIWDAYKPNGSSPMLFTENPVDSMDFNPENIDQLCTADIQGIRLWSVTKCTDQFLYKIGIRRVRFRPQDGNVLAASTHNRISLFDVKTKTQTSVLFCGHEKEVHTICWDASGKYIATVSEDKARIWSDLSAVGPIYEIQSNGGKKFESCTFHPQLTAVFVIGSYQSLEVWNPFFSNITESITAHSGIVSSLCTSIKAAVIASTSDDKYLNVWKMKDN